MIHPARPRRNLCAFSGVAQQYGSSYSNHTHKVSSSSLDESARLWWYKDTGGVAVCRAHRRLAYGTKSIVQTRKLRDLLGSKSAMWRKSWMCFLGTAPLFRLLMIAEQYLIRNYRRFRYMTPLCGHVHFNISPLGIPKNPRRPPRIRVLLVDCFNTRR